MQLNLQLSSLNISNSKSDLILEALEATIKLQKYCFHLNQAWFLYIYVNKAVMSLKKFIV